MLKKYAITILLIIATGVAFFLLLKLCTPKIAYVRSAELVNKYEGMKESRTMYKDKIAQWQSNIDTLESDYQKSVSKYTLESTKQSAAARIESENLLEKQRQNIQQYVKTLDEKAREEDQKMTERVINQINSFVEQYGKQHGYDFILGTTQSGNILYGSSSKDMTEEVLKELNESYKAGGIK